jgi:SAM-dependent methyltransferase
MSILKPEFGISFPSGKDPPMSSLEKDGTKITNTTLDSSVLTTPVSHSGSRTPITPESNSESTSYRYSEEQELEDLLYFDGISSSLSKKSDNTYYPFYSQSLCNWLQLELEVFLNKGSSNKNDVELLKPNGSSLLLLLKRFGNPNLENLYDYLNRLQNMDRIDWNLYKYFHQNLHSKDSFVPSSIPSTFSKKYHVHMPLSLRDTVSDKFDEQSNNSLSSSRQRSHQHRATNRTDEIVELLDAFELSMEGKKYLDYGCSNGSISACLGKRLGMDTYGCDIKYWHGIENQCCDFYVTYEHIPEDGNLPTFHLSTQRDSTLPMHCSFDLITAFMVLHHLETDKLEKAVCQLLDSLVPGGYLIIREHDVCSKRIMEYCHIEHALHDLVQPEIPYMQFFQEYIGDYKSIDEWEKYLSLPRKEGQLELLYVSKPWGATRYVYMFFRKLP